VQRLIELAQRPDGWALTVTFQSGRVNFGVVGNPDPKVVLDALSLVRDNILAAQAAREQKEKEAQSAMGLTGPPDGGPADFPADEAGSEDSEVPEQPVDGKK
jgi:hypothetical protein